MDAPQPTPAPVNYATDDEISLADIILFVSKYWIFVLVPAILGAVLCYAYFATQPIEFESTATLIIASNRVGGDQNRPTLNVQAYQKLIESEAIKRATAIRLVKEGVIPESKQPTIRTQTRIIPATRPDESAVLEATGYGRTSEEAVKVTNVWVATFLEHVQKTVTETNTVAGTVLLGQLTAAKQELAKQEDERVLLVQRLNKDFQAAQQKLELAIVEARTRSADKVAKYNAEAAQKYQAASAELNLDARKAELSTLQAVLLKLQQEQAELGPQIAAQKLQIDALRKNLEQTAPALALRRGMTDDAIWNNAAGKKQGNIDWSAMQKQMLVTESPNPLYQDLSKQLADHEIFIQSRGPRVEQLQKEIEGLLAQIQKREAELARDRSKLQSLEIEREAGLYKLKETTQLEIANAERQRDEDLKDLEAAHDDLKLRAERVILPQRDHTQQLAKSWNGILQAKATEELTDLRIGADAVEPTGPVVKKVPLYALAAAVAGAIAGLLIALVVHVRRSKPA